MSHVSGPVSLTEARSLPGLRLLAITGVPSPWTQAALGILHVKGVPYALVHATRDDPPGSLEAWTGQASYPVAVFDDEPPRDGWAEILLLAERLTSAPALIPFAPEERSLFFGLCHEIAGEMGFGWCQRLIMIARGIHNDPPDPMSSYLGGKYGFNDVHAAQAEQRVHDILRMLSQRLADQRAAGHRYLMGEQLTALDIYWATFCNLVSPLPPEKMPMAPPIAAMFSSNDPVVAELLGQGLLEHRDFIYDEHLVLPVVL